jgi:hypothetical protein
VVETICFSPATREVIQQLKSFFVAEGIATPDCFDKWVWEATGPKRPQQCRKVTSIRQAFKRALAQRRRATGKGFDHGRR